MTARSKKIAAMLLAVALLIGMGSILPSQTASAESLSVLQSQLDELEGKKSEVDQQLAQLESQKLENTTQMEAAAAQKDLIDQQVFLLYEQERTINQQIATLSLMIADKHEELDKAQAAYDALKQKHKQRLRAMEENGNISYWEVLFQANSFSDLLDRLDMIEQIARADRARLDQLNQAAKEVRQAEESLQTQKLQLENSKLELEENRKQLAQKREQADTLLAELAARGAEFQSLIDEGEKVQDDLLTQIAQKEKEYDAVEYQQWLSTSVPETTRPSSGGTSQTPPPSSSSEWLVPIDYTWFTSPFGMRWHPKSGIWKMHRGVDLAAPEGTPIYASRSGVVRTTSYEEGGAGYYVSVNHGDGYASIYMHMTHYIVSPGQYVSAGQVLGYCGSTGASTGPHLHFGISYNGEYVNPANYIPI